MVASIHELVECLSCFFACLLFYFFPVPSNEALFANSRPNSIQLKTKQNPVVVNYRMQLCTCGMGIFGNNLDSHYILFKILKLTLLLMYLIFLKKHEDMFNSPFLHKQQLGGLG